MSRSIFARAGAALVLVAIGVVLVLFLRDSGGGDDNQGAGPLPTQEVSTSAEAQELASLIKEGQDEEYYARYEASGPVVPKGGSVVIEAWHKDGQSRVEQTLTAEDRIVKSALFRLDDRSMSCAKQGDDPWQCTPAPEPTGADGDTDLVLGQVQQELVGKDVDVATKTIAGQKGRCFTLTEAGESSEVCVTNEGIPLRNARESARLELVELERTVDDDSVFEPPVSV